MSGWDPEKTKWFGRLMIVMALAALASAVGILFASREVIELLNN